MKMSNGSGRMRFAGSSTVGGIALFRYKIVLVPDLARLVVNTCMLTLPLLLDRFICNISVFL